jgi:flagellar hook protein FlgE
MKVENSNLNTMLKLEKALETSANDLAKLTIDSRSIDSKSEKKYTKIENQSKNLDDTNLTNEMVKQVEIPIAYTANAEVISVKDSLTRTLLDITV